MQNYTLRASTNYRALPNLEVGYNFVVNDYAGSKFYTDKPFAKLDYYFLDSFSLWQNMNSITTITAVRR